MRPTRRGVAVLGVALAATVVGSQFGQRGLAAIAAPLFVAVLGAAVQVRLSTPAAERSSANRGFVGESHTVSLSVSGSGVARLTDGRPEGISGPATVTSGLPTTVRYDLTYDRRGEHRLGPVEVVRTDTLGLVTTRETLAATDDVLVYPSVFRLGGPDAFLRTLASATEDQRTFDRLREYTPGDPMRDIHWKSSAKRDDLLVAEFDERARDRAVTVAAGAAEGHADAMATAAATVAVGALRSGFAVELATPDGTVDRGYGDRHRTRLLEALARTGSGTSGRENAEITVHADADGVTVTAQDRTRAFGELTTSRENPLGAGGRS